MPDGNKLNEPNKLQYLRNIFFAVSRELLKKSSTANSLSSMVKNP